MRKNKKNLSFHYDSVNDVLYVSISAPKPSYSEEILPDIFLRRDLGTDEITGVTIVNIRHQFETGQFPVELLPLGLDGANIKSLINGHVNH